MNRRSPPWGAIEAFVVAARVGGFKVAAEELGISASAFSRRIQTLEAHVGARLFDRGEPAPTLTAAGRRYLGRLAPGYEAIRAATDWMVPTPGRRPLRVGVTQSLAVSWLLPRLKDFQTRHPDIEVTLHTRSGTVDLAGGAADVGLIYGDGQWPGLRARRLMELEGFVVCAPELLGRGRQRLAALRGARLLETLVPPSTWQVWLDQTGEAITESTERLYFDSSQVMYEAAVRGMGVAFGIRPLVDAYLRDGRLIQVLPRSIRLPGGYYVAALPSMHKEVAVRAFWQWLVQQKP